MIDIKIQNLDELRKAFDPQAVDRAFRSAVTQVTRKVRTRVSEAVRAEYNIKAGEIGKAVTLKTLSGPEEQRLLLYTGKRIGLIHFGARPVQVRKNKRKYYGASVALYKSKGRTRPAGAFIGRGRTSDSQQVFKRMGVERGAPRYAGDEKLAKQTGPSIAHMVRTAGVQPAVQAVIAQDFDRIFAHEMERRVPGLMDNA